MYKVHIEVSANYVTYKLYKRVWFRWRLLETMQTGWSDYGPGEAWQRTYNIPDKRMIVS